jgi:hypothetical protein
LYEDVGPGRLAGAGLGGAAAGGAALPITGVELLQIAAVALLVMVAGVALLRLAAARKGSDQRD